jgi:propionate CoA-transferase
MIDQPYQFDFYDGGGLDLAFLSFAEIDAEGNVNVSRFGDRIIGVGGFINIAQNAKTVIFSGTLTAGDLAISWPDGKTHIEREGKHKKFVKSLQQICYSARIARERGQTALFVTERAVLRIAAGGLELTEVAPGVDLERDIFARMDFRPAVATNLRQMDPRLFQPGLMDLHHDLAASPRRYRTERIRAWHEKKTR